MKYDVILVGQIEGSQTGGFLGDGSSKYTYLETLAPTYLQNHFYHTFCVEPAFFLQLAAELRAANLTVKIIDGLTSNFTRDTLYNELLKYDASIYTFSIFHSSYDAVTDMVEKLKIDRPNGTIVTGGTYATLVYKPLLEKYHQFEYVVIGDGDVSLPALCRYIVDGKPELISQVDGIAYREKGEVRTNPSKPVDLDLLQPLARDLSDSVLNNKFSFSMVATRGCGYGVCSFCYLPLYQKLSNHPKYRHRSIDLIINEMVSLKNTYSVSHITFVDEDFFCGTPDMYIKRAIDFSNKIIELKLDMTFYVNARINTINKLIETPLDGKCENVIELLSKAGLRYVFVGIESGSDEVLKKYKKGITVSGIKKAADNLAKYNIKINPGLITFDPALTVDQIRANIDIMKYIEYYDILMFTRRLVILPGVSVGSVSGLWELPDKEHSDINYHFDFPETELLYEALVKLRNNLFDIYKFITDKENVGEVLQTKLIHNHFECFYKLVDAVKKDHVDKSTLNEIIQNYTNKAGIIVNYVQD